LRAIYKKISELEEQFYGKFHESKLKDSIYLSTKDYSVFDVL